MKNQKVSVTFGAYETHLLDALAEKFPHNLASPRERAWLIRQATRAVAEQILEAGEFPLPVSVKLHSETKAESDARRKKVKEIEGKAEIHADGESWKENPESPTTKPTSAFWDGFKRKGNSL